MFVTAETYAGALGSLEAADMYCRAAANTAGLTGTFRAWLSDGTTNAIDRITVDGPWYTTRGELAWGSKTELPGAPLESFGFLFGPSEPSGVTSAARIQTSRSGRKFPTFGIGVNGASGYRLQVTPAKKAVELFKGDTVAATAPFDWKSGEWTELRLSVRKVKDDEFAVEGKAWTAGTAEPAAPVVAITEAKVLPAGKSGAWGMPFAGTPIRFDDLKVTRLP